tara:strand:- start:1704 stop:2834 length:1131 start_codon:yes stop_codon:yes gene_type:complete
MQEILTIVTFDWPSLSNNFSISYTHGYGTQDALAALNNTSNDVYLISLDKNGGKWQASIGPGGEEEVAVNVKTGRITILARAKEYSELGRGSNDITDTFKSSWVFQCKKSALNLFNSRDKRNICDSEFSKVYLNYNPREAVTEVFTSGAQAIILTKLYKAKLDKDALNAALEQSQAYSYLINKLSKERYDEFERDFKRTQVIAKYSVDFVKKYGSVKGLLNHDFLVEARENARIVELTTTNSIYGLKRAIAKYGEVSDTALEVAKTRLAALTEEHLLAQKKQAEEERLAELKKQREEEEERKKKQLALKVWRQGVEVGDNTFCGRIIEKNSNSTMFKLALNIKLPGFDSTMWLHRSELYSPNIGCRNVNGKLSPIF